MGRPFLVAGTAGSEEVVVLHRLVILPVDRVGPAASVAALLSHFYLLLPTQP